MPIYQGQNYKVNRKVKEAVDKNQVNYRESADSPLSIIKRVYIYITDKKGHVLPEVTVTIDDETVTTGYGGLLISNFPNEEKTITVEKEGYKSATATIILDAEKQTHKFFLALETDEEDSEVISTDDTQPTEDELYPCDTLFELSDNNTLVTWSTLTNEIVDGVYTGNGSYIQEGWSNEGLWQIDYDVKYDTTNSSYVNYYAGVMPFCSEEINPYTNEKRKNYCMESWEKWAAIEGMDAICTEGPENYKYSQQNEYQHVTVKKTASDKIEYYFDNNKWVYSVPKLQNLETLHFGYRDNPSDRTRGVTISTKNLLVRKLCPKTNSEEETNTEPSANENEGYTEHNDIIMGVYRKGVVAGLDKYYYTVNCLIDDNFENLIITEVNQIVDDVPEPLDNNDLQGIAVNEVIKIEVNTNQYNYRENIIDVYEITNLSSDDYTEYIGVKAVGDGSLTYNEQVFSSYMEYLISDSGMHYYFVIPNNN